MGGWGMSHAMLRVRVDFPFTSGGVSRAGLAVRPGGVHDIKIIAGKPCRLLEDLLERGCLHEEILHCRRTRERQREREKELKPKGRKTKRDAGFVKDLGAVLSESVDLLGHHVAIAVFTTDWGAMLNFAPNRGGSYVSHRELDLGLQGRLKLGQSEIAYEFQGSRTGSRGRSHRRIQLEYKAVQRGARASGSIERELKKKVIRHREVWESGHKMRNLCRSPPHS